MDRDSYRDQMRRMSQQRENNDRSRQSEQWQEDASFTGQHGDSHAYGRDQHSDQMYDSGNGSYSNDHGRNRDRDFGSQSYRPEPSRNIGAQGYGSPGSRNQASRNTRGGGFRDYEEGGSAYSGRSGRSRFGNGQSDFTSDAYGGRDFYAGDAMTGFGAGAGYAAGGYGGYSGAMGRSQNMRGGYGNTNDRGFLEKAGDHIASWFGDDEAERRLESDHSGRGPEGYSRSDERILEDVCDTLTRDSQVDARKVTVSVTKGEVTLDGTVDSLRAKRRAEDCAHHASGVGHVQNNLRVDNSSSQARGSQSLLSPDRNSQRDTSSI